VLHPDDRYVFAARLLDQRTDIRNDGVALVRAVDDAGLDVDDK
jgi:hypothetical protein